LAIEPGSLADVGVMEPVTLTHSLCRSCGAPLSTVFVDLGMQPIADALVPIETATSSEAFYPLKSFVCDECHLVQLQDVADQTAHFHDEYVYFSSFATTWVEHARHYVDMAIGRFDLGPRSQVIEIASNDGYLLRYFVDRTIPCFGIDPAANCAQTAFSQYGVETEIAFFGRGTAERLRSVGKTADLIIANNVLAHVPDLNDFVAGLKVLLKPTGTITLEFPHLLQLIRGKLFDTIYHEHYSYLSLLAVQPLFDRHGLTVVDLDLLQTHGGSLRLYVRHAEHARSLSPSLLEFAAEERAFRLDDQLVFRDFGEQVRAIKRALLSKLIELKNQGTRIAAYGAPAKGNTLLNYCGIGSDFIDFTVDRNPHKQGKLLPGTRIPVLAPEVIFEAKPDYVLLLPWNLKDEIVSQLRGMRGWGGRLIVPLPKPEIIAV
jgi:SAM-dependent methyltransferase